MIYKNKLELLSNTENVLNMSQSSIDAFKIDDDMKESAVTSIILFMKGISNHFSHEIIEKHLENKLANFDIVYMKKYSLPATFNLNTRRAIINIATFNKRNILNIDPRDLYTSILYSYTFAIFIQQKLPKDMIRIYADYLSAFHIKAFAKKYGLAGSYQSELPKLRYIITLYTIVSYFNIPQKDAYVQANNISKVSSKDFSIDISEYDLTQVSHLIKLLSESNVLRGISLYEYVSTMVRKLMQHNIVLLEDPIRFISILSAATINSNLLYPQSLQFVHKPSYDKIINYVEKYF